MIFLSLGLNGAIITGNYPKAQRCLKYLEHGNVRKFETLQEAQEAAREHLTEVLPMDVVIPDHIGVNDFITEKNLRNRDRDKLLGRKK